MIVKFIAVICLLLFIPKLEIKKTIKKVNMQSNNDDDDDEDEGRSLRNGNVPSSDLHLERIYNGKFLIDWVVSSYFKLIVHAQY